MRATMLSDRSGASRAVAYESMAETSRGNSVPPISASSVASTNRSGQGEPEPGGGFVGFVEFDDAVLELQQGSGVHLEGEVQVEGATARLFGMQFDFPHLTQ